VNETFELKKCLIALSDELERSYQHEQITRPAYLRLQVHLDNTALATQQQKHQITQATTELAKNAATLQDANNCLTEALSAVETLTEALNQ
jgi:fatty acid-binding protein DegV